MVGSGGSVWRCCLRHVEDLVQRSALLCCWGPWDFAHRHPPTGPKWRSTTCAGSSEKNGIEVLREEQLQPGFSRGTERIVLLQAVMARRRWCAILSCTTLLAALAVPAQRLAPRKHFPTAVLGKALGSCSTLAHPIGKASCTTRSGWHSPKCCQDSAGSAGV